MSGRARRAKRQRRRASPTYPHQVRCAQFIGRVQRMIGMCRHFETIERKALHAAYRKKSQ